MHDAPHRSLTMVQPSMYSFTGPSSGPAPHLRSPATTMSGGRQRSNSDGSLLHSPSPPLLVPRISSQGTEQANYSHSPVASSVYPNSIPIPAGPIPSQQHQQQQQSPTSPNVWPSSLDDKGHNLGFIPYMQVAYPPYAPASSGYPQSPTVALPQDPTGPQIPRWTLAGSLDPTTGIFYRTPEHPRLRTAQACEKCRTRKAKCSGDHPSCHRCLTRGLTCQYAAEGRMRGPNKPKNKNGTNSPNESHMTSRRNSIASTQNIGKKRAPDPVKAYSSETESDRRPNMNLKRHSMPVLSTNPKERREKGLSADEYGSKKRHSAQPLQFGLGNTGFQGMTGGNTQGGDERSVIRSTETLTGERVLAAEMGPLFTSPQPQQAHSSSMSSCSGYDEASMMFHTGRPGHLRHYTVDGGHVPDYGGQGMDVTVMSPFLFPSVDSTGPSSSSHTNSFTSSPVSGLPSPVTPSLGVCEDGNLEVAFQHDQHTYAQLQDRNWIANTGIHNFDNQHHGMEKLGWDNFPSGDDGTESFSVQYLEL